MKTQQFVFAIGIPTINRADLLQPTLEKMQKDFPNTAIYVMDNGKQDFDIKKFTSNNVFIIKNDENIGVAASWNKLLHYIYNGDKKLKTNGCGYALILNDDIYLGKTESQVMKFIWDQKELCLATTTGTWCAFILNQLTHKKIGDFDEKFFPAYFEDNDYSYRMLLSGFKHTSHTFLDPEVYRNSQTIAKDPSLNNKFEENKAYYVRKWGGEPYKETFLTPFNEL